jgi:uncharacterized protein YbjT (DUF2867 family)
MSETAVRTVLLLGAGGFIGAHVAVALKRAGWRVVHGVRRSRAGDSDDTVQVDLVRWTSPRDWARVLHGVDAVVNAAGILRESRVQTFDTIHHDAPLALAHACVQAGVRDFVQISALGEDCDGEFIASKHRFDRALAALPLRAVVLRPSVVFSTRGSYGGTTLLRALAALPGVLPLPGDGRWRMQPMAAEDLGELVVRALRSDARGIFEIGGPEPITMRDYQRQWRDWLRLPRGREIHVPVALVSAAVACGERLGAGPMGETIWRMLQRGNVTASDAWVRANDTFGIAPRGVGEVLAAQASQVQDRWHAQLHLLAPLLRFAVVVVFLISAWVGFTTPAAAIQDMVSDSVLRSLAPVALARATAGLDLVLGIALAIGWRPRLVVTAMLALVTAYTLAFGLVLPELWFDPLGGLLKNLVILPALMLLRVLLDRR